MFDRLVRSCISARLAVVAAALTAAALTAGQSASSPWSGVLENYLQMSRPTKGLFYSESWLELRNRLSDQWKVILTYDYTPGSFTFDANYAEYDRPNMYLRLGRLRSAFGFGQWSDTNYNVEIADPIIRQDPILPNLGLNRLDNGAEWQQSYGNYQVTLGLLDVDTGPVQMQPEDMNRQQGRIQTTLGPLIVGANLLVKELDPRSSAGDMYSADFRWTTPHLLARGEFVRGAAPGFSTEGYYVDLTYRPPKFFRTELGIRNEAYDVLGSGQRTFLTTYGIRQIIGKMLTLNLNYTSGKAYGDFITMPGWSFQVVVYTHF